MAAAPLVLLPLAAIILSTAAAEEFDAPPPPPRLSPSCSARCHKFAGDGDCDFMCNVAKCAYDGGDCKRPQKKPSPPAPKNCIGRWSECSSACLRTYRIVSTSANGGLKCSAENGAIDAQTCKPGQGQCGGSSVGSATQVHRSFPASSVGVTCKPSGTSTQCSRTKSQNGKLAVDTSSAGKEIVAETFYGTAGKTYTLKLRMMANDKVGSIVSDGVSFADKSATFVAVRIAPAESLSAQPKVTASLPKVQKNSAQGYVYSGSPNAMIEWVCTGSGSWSIMLDATCAPSQNSGCVFGLATELTAMDRSTEPGAMACSSPPGTPGRMCHGKEVTISIPVHHSDSDKETQAQLARMFTVTASPTTVIPTQIKLANGGKQVIVTTEMRAANKDALKELRDCIDHASTAAEMQQCGEHNAVASHQVQTYATKPATCPKPGNKKDIFGRRMQSSQCGTFCGAGRPCTPPCQAWGCGNCGGGGGGGGSGSSTSSSNSHSRNNHYYGAPPPPSPRWLPDQLDSQVRVKYVCSHCVGECHCGNAGSSNQCKKCSQRCAAGAVFATTQDHQDWCRMDVVRNNNHRGCPSCIGGKWKLGTPPVPPQGRRGGCPVHSHVASSRLDEDLYYNGMSCTCDRGYAKAANGISCARESESLSKAVARGQCQDQNGFEFSSAMYGVVTCDSLRSKSWAGQECSPSSQYGLFKACPVGCNSLCSIEPTHVTPSKYQSFVGGPMHGINAWFSFDGKAGTTYKIETHNEGKMYLYDAKLMSAKTYSPQEAMLGGTEHSRLYSNVPYQRLTWTCPAAGKYAVLIAQSRWDCNNGCGKTDLSVTGGTAAQGGIDVLTLVPNIAPLEIATACTIEDRRGFLPICHYRKLSGGKDNGWINGLGGMQFTMNLEGRAGHTYHFDFNSFSESTIRDLTSKKFFEVKVPSKGNQGYETLHLDYGGSNGLNARVTLYPPAAVGGARGWEHHIVRLGNWHSGGEKPSSDDSAYASYPGMKLGGCQSFNWTCAASGTWRVVVEANCDVVANKHCTSGFTLATTSEDESGSSLTCEQQNGNSICTGPKHTISMEADAQMARMFGLQQKLPPSKPSGGLQPVHLMDPHDFAGDHEAQAQLARMFDVSHPPALTLVKDIKPSAKPGHTDVTIEIRAANADVTNSISDCLKAAKISQMIQNGQTQGESLAQMSRMFPAAHDCVKLNPVLSKVTLAASGGANGGGRLRNSNDNDMFKPRPGRAGGKGNFGHRPRPLDPNGGGGLDFSPIGDGH